MKIERPLDIPQKFPVRKSRKQKEDFRIAVQEYAQAKGFSVVIEQGSFNSHNIIIGSADTAEYLVTAHYDTCARMIIPNLVTPCNFGLFLLYQLFTALVLIVPTLLIYAVVSFLTQSFMLAYIIWLLFLFAEVFLMMFGPANPTNVNDNTSGVISVLEIMTSLPENQKDKVCFVLFDLEEAGLLGSSSYRKKHRNATNSQIVLNLDCVGEGDEIYFFPTGKLKKDADKLSAFDSICGKVGKKRITVRKRGFAFFPSDQMQFPYGCGICALSRSKLGLYTSKIHTPKDTVLDETNVNILRAALITLISRHAAE